MGQNISFLKVKNKQHFSDTKNDASNEKYPFNINITKALPEENFRLAQP